MKYTETTIDQVRDADIVKTIQHFLPDLKRKGSTHIALSPFTNEKTPSFTVSPVKQIFKCYSSGFGGDGIAFVMQHKTLDFIEAIKIIAGIHNIYLDQEDVTPEQQSKYNLRLEMFALMQTVSKKYLATRRKLKLEHWAIKLLNARQFSEDALVNFMVGFAPVNNEVTKWATDRGQLGLCKSLGISDTKNSHSFDKFKNRIIFPIHDHKGHIVAFGGRRSDLEEDANYAKYLNSVTSDIYNKSKILYGLFQAKKSITISSIAILTEGYTDVIALHSHGCDNTIASCGTALTDAHAALLKKYAKEVILLRDGDAAGQRATMKDIDICLAAGLRVSLCALPDGEDPDSFARSLDGKIGDWIDQNKRDAIHWKVEQYDLLPESYAADVAAIKKSTLDAIKTAQAELVPDEKLETLKGLKLKNARSTNSGLLKEIEKFKKQEREYLAAVIKVDANKKEVAFTNIAETLYQVKHEVKRNVYLSDVCKIMGFSKQALKREIGQMELRDSESKQKKKGLSLPDNLKLPQGADIQEYLEHGFVSVGNTHWFENAKGFFFQGTDFKLVPLFHIMGDKENKRLCELINTAGQKIMIDFDSDMLASFNEFRRYLFHYNGFAFYTHNGMRSDHFDRFVIRFNRQFTPALELLTLGWHPKGFFAFADGVHWSDEFKKVNKYGVVYLEGLDGDAKEYNQSLEYYYSPAFSIMHRDNQEGDDRYENDRFFVYKKSPITFMDWMGQMETVFGDKGVIGILFVLGTLFRDLYLRHDDSFPLLGGFGEKDSGKSAFGKIIQNFFYYRLPALDLTQATHVGFSRRMSRNVNTIQFLDEYQDKYCDDRIFSGMMGGWNGIGREKGMNTGDKRTQYDKINSAIYYAGQFMPTRMENALATRTISLMFQTKNYTSEQKDEFNKLLNWTNEGLSSLVIGIVEHREYFKGQLPSMYAETVRKLKGSLKEKNYQERVFGNVAKLYTTYRILAEKLSLPFSEDRIQKMLVKIIIENSEMIMDSNGLTEFWSIIQHLFENNTIKAMQDFKIESPASFSIIGAGRQKAMVDNSGHKQILYLRLNSAYQWYNKEVTKREGVDVIGKTTIMQYFKSRSYFIGLVKGTRFGKFGSHSAYAFYYDDMEALNLINFMQEADDPFAPDTPPAVNATEGEKDDDMPF